MYIVQGNATHDSNAAEGTRSNVLKVNQGTVWKQQPHSSCAIDHQRAREEYPNDFDHADFDYSHRRQADVNQLDKLILSGQSRLDAEAYVRQTLNAAHDPSLCIGPATWTLSQARDIKKDIKKQVYGVGQSAATVIAELQESHKARLRKWTDQHHPSKEVLTCHGKLTAHCMHQGSRSIGQQHAQLHSTLSTC